MNDDATRIRHILDCVLRIQDWTNVGKQGFLSNPMMQSAVVHELEVIGEAAKAVSKELRAKQSRVPWREMAGLRDVVIHDYDTIDAEEVWRVVEGDLPSLKRELSAIKAR